MSLSSEHEDQDIRDLPLPAGTLRVLQITDTHLYEDPKARLIGVNTLGSLRSVIDAIGNLGWDVDLVLATGDLVHDASPAGYRDLGKLLDRFERPVLCIPGNHDDPAIMRENLGTKHVSMPHVFDMGGWRFVMLDSVLPGQVGGRLGQAELGQLQNALKENHHPTMVCLHHQPVPIGSPWIDDMGLDNAGEFLAILQQEPAVRGVLWGHVHQSYDVTHQHVRLMATPSTCVQFAAHSDDFAIDDSPPGFRLLALTPDGGIHSQVMRTNTLPEGLDPGSEGYD